MGSMKGGSESQTSVPQFVEDGGKYGVDRSKQLAEMGYMPYFGPDVAALSPMEYAGMQNTAGAANAFGMASPGMGGTGQGGDPLTGLPQAENYGGMAAYSSAPIYQGALDQLQQRRPGQFDAYNSMFIDPQTGVMGGAGQQVEPQNLWDQMITGSGIQGRAQQNSIDRYGNPSMAHMFMK